MPKEIIIAGFPKCGTTAIMRSFEQDSDIEALKTPDDRWEMSWPLIKEVMPTVQTDKIIAHKFTGYVFNEEALSYLSQAHPDAIIVACVRDLERTLVSWHGMHKRIAKSGKNPNHMAYKERDFYADCTVAEYYEKYAKRRLRQDIHVKNLVEICGKARVVVVSQEWMARDMDGLVNFIKARARGEDASTPILSEDAVSGHESRAEKSKTKVPLKIKNELERSRKRLEQFVEESGIAACI